MKVVTVLGGKSVFTDRGTLGACSVYLIRDEKNIIVDTGHFGSRDALVQNMGNLGISANEVDFVVLTHLNWDHCLNVDIFKDAKVVLGKEEHLKGTLTGANDSLSVFFRKYIEERDLLLIEGDRKISENVSVISTPGHTPGHVALLALDEGRKLVFTGDAVPNMRAYRRGVPDYVFHDLSKAKASVERIKAMKPDVIYPGHDDPFNDSGYIDYQPLNIFVKTSEERDICFQVNFQEPLAPLVYEGI